LKYFLLCTRIYNNQFRNKVQQLIRNEKTGHAHRFFGPHLSTKTMWSNLHSRGIAPSRGNGTNETALSPDSLNNSFLNVPPTDPTAVNKTLAFLRNTPPIANDPLYFAPISAYDVKKFYSPSPLSEQARMESLFPYSRH
jgi:hypothetical protein